MTTISIEKNVTVGIESYLIQNEVIELSFLPEFGGKINSLRDLRNGREWLWRHPRLPYKRVAYGGSYVKEADTGGWDECFPSVAECKYPSAPWRDALIQDHGELWSQSPEFEISEQSQSVLLRTLWQGIALPYTFRRVITLVENSAVIHVDYEVVNNSDQPMNYVWCIHPLLAIEPGMELHLPASAKFNVGGASPQNLVSSSKNLQYPFAASGLNFPVLPETSAGVSIKIWSEPLPVNEGWAELHANNGQLKMRWDAAVLPQIAAWMNLGAWGFDGGTPYYNLGLEPCIGAQDSLNDAVNRFDLFETIPPRGSKKWWLEIELTA